MFLSRRLLLVSGAAVAALTAVGATQAVLPAAALGRRVLSAGEGRLVEALGEALFPPDSLLGVSGVDVDLPAAVDELLGETLDTEIRYVFRYFLRALDEGTALSRGAGFASLSLGERRAVLVNWQDNAVVPRRMMHDMFRLVMGMAFFNQQAVIHAIGWRAECSLGSA